MKTIFTLFFSMVLLMNVGFSQKAPEKFSKLSAEVFKSKYCPIDSAATAYFLFDFGKTDFRYATTQVRDDGSTGGQKGFQMFFERHFRIKILDNEANHWANIEIPLYHTMDGSTEEITKFRAITYNMEGKKITETNSKGKDLIKEEKNKHWDIWKIALPNIKEGSVIEVHYIVKSDFYFNLQKWQFQHTIPVVRSEYYVSIPEYFIYNKSVWGYYPIKTDQDHHKNQITITHHEGSAAPSSLRDGQSKRSTWQQTVDYDEIRYSFLAESIPAFPIEKYLTTADNYLSKVEFELSMTRFPGSTEKYYSNEWDDINEHFLNHYDFGKQLAKQRLFKDLAASYTLATDDPMALMLISFDAIKDKLTWDGFSQKYTSDNLRAILKNGNGNSADINLSLVALLRETGLDAYPVLISTRSNGLVHPTRPSISSFNYVIAACRLNDQYYLMDATEPLSEINLLPTRCLNSEGWLVDERRAGWVNLMNGNYGKSTNYTLSLDENGTFTGSIDYKYTGYGAYLERIYASKETDHANYLDTKFENISGLEILKSEVNGLDSLNSSVNYHLEVKIKDKAQKAGNLLLFSPMFFDATEENPFKIEHREYPVEYKYPQTEMVSVSITLPDSYIVDELPKPAIINLDDKSAKLMYNVNQLGNKVQITSVFSINKTIFLPDQYPYLKQIIDIAIDKHESQIILKSK